MKKTALTIAAAAAITGIAAGLLVWNRGSAAAPIAAAQVLPAETLLVLEAPDCRGSLARWPQTALAHLLSEPETVAFLEHPLSCCPKRALWSHVLEHLNEADIRQGFFALTGISDNMPHVVGGLAFRATRRESMERAVALIRAQAQAANPSGKFETIEHRGCVIETFSAREVTVAAVFAGDWFFFGNDVKLLEATLDRPAGKRSARAANASSLATDPSYAACQARMPANADFRFYAKASPFIEKVLALTGVDRSQTEWLRKIEAVAGATRIVGQRMHDRICVLQPGCPRLPELTRATLRLTSPDTLFYYAFAPAIPDSLPLASAASTPSSVLGAGPLQGLLWGMRGFAQSLTELGVRVEDFKASFGPEFAALLNWPAASSGADDAGLPPFHLAGQVRNGAAARKFADTLFASLPRKQTQGVTLWTYPPPYSPTVALTNDFLLTCFTGDPNAAVTRLGKKGDSLEASKEFTAAVATVAQPGNTLVYLDTRALLDRTHDWLSCMATIWANFVPHAGDYVQMNRLPSYETVSKHLLPMVLSAKQTGDGALIETSGPITFFQASAALGALTSAAAVPVIEGKATVPRVDTLIETLLSLSQMQEHNR